MGWTATLISCMAPATMLMPGQVHDHHQLLDLLLLFL